MTTETPDTVHGRLMEGVHIAGYTFERACGELEWLLTEDRWKAVAGGYADINAFLKTIDFSEFRLALEQRKKLAKRLADIEASQRATARLLGVDQATVARDLGMKRDAVAANAARVAAQPQESTQTEIKPEPVAANAAPAWFQADTDPSRAAKREVARQQRQAERAEPQTQQAGMTERARRCLADVCELRVASCAELFCSGVRPDVVITDPPYPQEFLPLYEELAVGCVTNAVPLVAVMCGHSYLPELMALMCRHLRYRWTLAYLTPGGQAAQQWTAKVNTFWKPILLFGEANEWIGDVVRSATNDNDKRFHDWGQSESGMTDLVERLTKPGQLVCDPFVGGGTTAVVALALGRRFLGCDVNPKAIETTLRRVELLFCDK